MIRQTTLLRGIRKWDLVALLINGIIGAGIFGLPSRIYSLTHTYSLLAFLVCAVVVSMIVLCFAEVSSRFTGTGGPYLYARESFGPAVGFVVGWLTWITRMTAFATICNLLVTYSSYFWPAATSDLWRPVIITGVVAALAILNLTGIRETAIFSNIFTIGKLIPILVFVVVGLFFLDFKNYSLETKPDLRSFSTAVLFLLYAFSGFEASTVAAGEVQEPRRTFPFALLVAIGVVVTLYLLIQVVCIGTLPDLASSERPLADASSRFLGAGGSTLITLGALISMTGTLNSSLLSGTRMLFAMSEQGQLPQILSVTHKRFHTPSVSILLTSLVILAVTLSNTFMSALTLATITRLITYGITCAGLPVLRRKEKELPATFTVPGGIIVAALSSILCIWLLYSSSWREVRDVAAVTAFGALLCIAYKLWKRHN